MNALEFSPFNLSLSRFNLLVISTNNSCLNIINTLKTPKFIFQVQPSLPGSEWLQLTPQLIFQIIGKMYYVPFNPVALILSWEAVLHAGTPQFNLPPSWSPAIFTCHLLLIFQTLGKRRDYRIRHRFLTASVWK